MANKTEQPKNKSSYKPVLVKNKQNQTNVFKYPLAVARKYSSVLVGLIKEMRKETEKRIFRLISKSVGRDGSFLESKDIAKKANDLINSIDKDYGYKFSKIEKPLAKNFVSAVANEATVAVKKNIESIKGVGTVKVSKATAPVRNFKAGALAKKVTTGRTDFGIKLSDVPTETKNILQASINENVELIRSIPSEYFHRIKQEVNLSILSKDSSLSKLTKVIYNCGGISESHAMNIALDQTRKAYTQVAIDQARINGVTKAIWRHQLGSKTQRPKHVAFDGKLFDLTKGAPVGLYGNYVLPAQEPYCRCTFRLVVDW